MRFYQQQGSKLKHTNLNESDNICGCCDSKEHYQDVSDRYPEVRFFDDAECSNCGNLCSCACHRPVPESPPESAHL